MSATSSKPTTAESLGPSAPFWQTKTLAAMSQSEWESLCDGCGRCCLHKLEEEGPRRKRYFYTNVACRMLDLGSCRCKDYAERQSHVPDCIQLTPKEVAELGWLPSTCAYRLLAEGKPLAWWHPLVSGDPETVHRAGISVRGRAIPEQKAGPLNHHLVTWVD